tara:strand:- start:80 stop:829 length:750 start_codon:yes stop_codon:yes gene_type:complete
MSIPSSCLLIDHGNSRIKWALSDAGDLSVGEAIDYLGEETDFSPWEKLNTVQRILVSNSAGPQAFAYLTTCCQNQWQLKPESLQAQSAQYGIVNSYIEPETLGADRWLALIAARQIFKDSLVVIDCGTAVTCDALSGEGVFLGGIISAGPRVSADALIKKAAHLDLDEMRYRGAFNTDTTSAISAGSLIFTAGGIEKVLSEFRAKLGDELPILMTGGWADTLVPLMDSEAAMYPDLVLQGIQFVAGQES